MATEQAAKKPAGLAAKMAAAMGEIGRVQKRGRNQAQGYSYARADDVAEEARKVLASHGIAVFADVKEAAEREVQGKNGTIRIYRVTVAWTFKDGESGEEHTVSVPGEGMDTGDKGIFKAMTGSMKYALMLGFLIPTGDGDPEKDSDEEKPPATRTDTVKAKVAAAAKELGGKVVPANPAARQADVSNRLLALGLKAKGDRLAKVGEWIGRAVDDSTALSADDWTRCDAGLEQMKAAQETLARAQGNGERAQAAH
jgi:hypothetical protein